MKSKIAPKSKLIYLGCSLYHHLYFYLWRGTRHNFQLHHWMFVVETSDFKFLCPQSRSFGFKEGLNQSYYLIKLLHSYPTISAAANSLVWLSNSWLHWGCRYQVNERDIQSWSSEHRLSWYADDLLLYVSDLVSQITSFIMSVMETHVLYIYTHISTRDATPTEIHEKQLQHRDKCCDFKWKRDNWVIDTLLLNPLMFMRKVWNCL